MALRRRLSNRKVALACLCALPASCVWAGAGSGAEPAPAKAGERVEERLPRLPAFEGALDEVRELVANAHFRTAMGVAKSTRDWADELPSSPETREARAQLLVLLATCQIALGEEKRAFESMQSALYVWPLLSLDEQTTSPRVVALFRRLRTSASQNR